MIPALLHTVDQLRSGALDARASQRMLAELEFDLADKLADGPCEVTLEGVPVVLNPGLEHHELAVLLDLLTAPPADLRTALWVAHLPHVGIDRRRETAPAAARRRLAPDADPLLRQGLPPGDLRRLHEEGQLEWLAEADSLPADRGPAPEPMDAPPPPTAARWRRFVHAGVGARTAGDAAPSVGLLSAAFDDLVRLRDVAAVAAILAAARTATGPGAALLVQALDAPERVAAMMLASPALGSDTPATVLVAMLGLPDSAARCNALSRLVDRNAPEGSPALIAALRCDDFHDRPREEKRAFLAALPRVDERTTNSLLVGILEERDKKDEALAETQVLAVELLGRRWTATVDAAIRRESKGFGLHRSVRKAVKSVLAAGGSK